MIHVLITNSNCSVVGLLDQMALRFAVLCVGLGTVIPLCAVLCRDYVQ